MGKPDAITRRTGTEKSGAEERILKEGQLLVQEEDKNQEEDEAPDVELRGIDCSRWNRDESGSRRISTKCSNSMS